METAITIETKRILVESKRWLEAVKDIDIIKIALAPVLDMSKWSAFMHQHVQHWALGVTDVMPIPIQKYIAGLKD